VQCNTQSGIINDFEKHFSDTGLYHQAFKENIMQVNQQEPSAAFATAYLQQANTFIAFAKEWREKAVSAAF
jgi:sulfite reductase (ferredoxin)